MEIKDYVNAAHDNAVDKGFYEGEKSIPQSLALIHSEVSEALEADRKGDPDNFAEELADICIRVFDLAGWQQIDLQDAIEYKMAKNKERPRKHGKRY